MEHSSLVAFLEGDLSPEQFAQEIGDEVTACNEGFRSNGIGYINIGDGPATVITRDHARRLLEAVSENRLPFEFANYTADCIIMSDDFDFADEAVNEAIYFVEDDSIVPTVEEARAAIERLGR